MTTRWKNNLIILAAFFSGITTGALLMHKSLFTTEQLYERTNSTKALLRSLATALNAYNEEFNSFPSGNEVQIALALSGHNSKKTEFLHLHEHFGKELPDVYGTPIRIIIKGDNFHLWSAGPNRIWGDADDYHYCSLCGFLGQANIHSPYP